MNNKSNGIADILYQTINDIENGKITDKDQIKEYLERFKHERFIHLLVTTFVGLFFVVLLISTDKSIFIIILTVIMLILEGCYLYHYYRLENGVQKLNQLYLNFLSKKKK